MWTNWLLGVISTPNEGGVACIPDSGVDGSMVSVLAISVKEVWHLCMSVSVRGCGLCACYYQRRCGPYVQQFQ